MDPPFYDELLATDGFWERQSLSLVVYQWRSHRVPIRSSKPKVIQSVQVKIRESQQNKDVNMGNGLVGLKVR